MIIKSGTIFKCVCYPWRKLFQILGSTMSCRVYFIYDDWPMDRKLNMDESGEETEDWTSYQMRYVNFKRITPSKKTYRESRSY